MSFSTLFSATCSALSPFRSRASARCSLLSIGLLLAGCASLPAVSQDFKEPVKVGATNAALEELSGLAPSRRVDNVLWGHNDSGSDPEFEAIELSGKRIGQVRVKGIKNRDWEDMASFVLDGQPWILLADVGDNNAVRNDCVLYIVAEPKLEDLSPDKNLKVPVAWKVPIRYEDGPRDCESVAVDATEGRVYLLSKRTKPPFLYWVPLKPAAGSDEPVIAKKLTPVNGIPAATQAQNLIPAPTGRYRPSPTGMDFSSDGTRAVLLTYGDVWIYTRAPGKSWAEAFASPAKRLEPHGLMQAEAVCFSRDGRSIFVGGEGTGSAMLRYDPR